MPDGQATTSPAFPGRTIRANEADSQLVSQVQGALLQRGYGPFKDGVFDASMTAIVKLFQAQHSDVDGAVAGNTVGWGNSTLQLMRPTSPSTLMLHALAVAGTQVGQMEVPPGSNRGPMVDEYLDAVGIPPAQGTAADRFWCMAFVYWTFKTAAASLGVPNPLPKTASCAGHWKRAQNIPGAVRITRQAAFADVSLIKPGLIAILDFGGGAGHTFIVERMLDSGRIATIEGNTNNDGSNNGVGVFRLDRRKLSDKSIVGFVDYSKA
jgi:peptidoglycan hydrolase-like protein with peptidoglycan-binding domain